MRSKGDIKALAGLMPFYRSQAAPSAMDLNTFAAVPSPFTQRSRPKTARC